MGSVLFTGYWSIRADRTFPDIILRQFTTSYPKSHNNITSISIGAMLCLRPEIEKTDL